MYGSISDKGLGKRALNALYHQETFNPIGNHEWELKIAQELGIENAGGSYLFQFKASKRSKAKPKDWSALQTAAEELGFDSEGLSEEELTIAVESVWWKTG
jgi:hypothetical protein